MGRNTGSGRKLNAQATTMPGRGRPVPSIHQEAVGKTATQLRQAATDALRSLQSHGIDLSGVPIRVIAKPEHNHNIGLYAAYIPGEGHILVHASTFEDNKKTPEEMRHIMLHELGHAYLHKSNPTLYHEAKDTALNGALRSHIRREYGDNGHVVSDANEYYAETFARLFNGRATSDRSLALYHNYYQGPRPKSHK